MTDDVKQQQIVKAKSIDVDSDHHFHSSPAKFSHSTWKLATVKFVLPNSPPLSFSKKIFSIVSRRERRRSAPM
jgi:hypothetical protein